MGYVIVALIEMKCSEAEMLMASIFLFHQTGICAAPSVDLIELYV